MLGLMMDYPLALDMILRRAETLYQDREVVSRLASDRWHRYTFGELAVRAKQLALAVQSLGIGPGERVATLCWNHYRHLEAYFGVPLAGAVLHTLNPRLAPDDLIYIVNQAEDRALIVDASLLPVVQRIRDHVDMEHVIVVPDTDSALEGAIDYDQWVEAEDAASFSYPRLDEHQAAMMCYTSGTIGRPKGVVYSHRALTLHSLVGALTCGFAICETDCLLPAVPMYHVNAWGLPYIAVMMGAKLVFSGQWLDAESLLEAFQQEQVTFTAGVPTIWIQVLKTLDANPGRYDVSALRRVIVGGASLPKSLMQAYRERHQVRLSHAWGMTETTPMGTISYLRHGQETQPTETQDEQLARQGTPVPLVEIRARGANGIVDWDGKTMGELEIRGPCVAGEYFRRPDAADRFTEDGWFRTGDIVSINTLGIVKIEDREKDLIKSGGEWISSVDLENAIMAHPSVSEAAVVAVPHEKWGERPLAAVVLRPGGNVTADELQQHLEPRVAKWWIPDRFEFVEAIPKTAVGKFRKSELRERFGSTAH